jgi:hypothetical protein
MEKEDQNKGLQESSQEGTAGAGRLQPAEQKVGQGGRDISHIDQQEGNMEHGELGGNLNETQNREEDNTKKDITS